MNDVVPLMARPFAQDMFADLLARLLVSGPARRELTDLLHEPFRTYHSAGHAGTLWYRHLAHGGDRDDMVAAHAIAYHDAVYRVGAADNEAQSAALWMRHAYDQTAALREAVGQVIMATACHGTTYRSDDAQWMVDLDLTPLGEPWPLFQATSGALRREAPGIPVAVARASQRQFLARLAQLPRLYRSPRHDGVLGRVYEATAQQNLARVLAGDC